MIVETYLRRHQPGLTFLLVAVAIWIAIIVYSVTTLVPINHRIARMAGALPVGWREEHKRWDTYHRGEFCRSRLQWSVLFGKFSGNAESHACAGVAQRSYECHPQ
jgi:hypothetical protein